MEDVKFEDIPRLIGEMYMILKGLQERVQLIENGSSVTIEDEILDFEQAARLLRISESTLYKKTSRKEVPFSKRGKLIYFSKDELMNYIKTGSVSPAKDVARNAKLFVENMSRKRF